MLPSWVHRCDPAFIPIEDDPLATITTESNHTIGAMAE
jgi:hypothetical protein